jgi:hypothetical protein
MPMIAVIPDLQALSAGRYRLEWEPPATPTGGVPEEDRPLYRRVKCRYGHVGVWGPGRLYAHASRIHAVRKIEAMPFADMVQRGDSECNATFDPEHLAEVCTALGAYLRRRVSAAQADRLAAYRFARDAGQALQAGQGSHARPSVDPEATDLV